MMAYGSSLEQGLARALNLLDFVVWETGRRCGKNSDARAPRFAIRGSPGTLRGVSDPGRIRSRPRGGSAGATAIRLGPRGQGGSWWPPSRAEAIAVAAPTPYRADRLRVRCANRAASWP